MSSKDAIMAGADLTPMHTKMSESDIIRAYDYVSAVVHTADVQVSPTESHYMWGGWALREAFLAGMRDGKRKESAFIEAMKESKEEADEAE